MSNFSAHFPLLLICIALSWSGTGLIRRYAGERWLDQPGWRRSHTRSTPRAGGFAFVVVWLMALVWLIRTDQLYLASVSGLAGGVIIIALGGLLDDRFELAPRYKLTFQTLGAAWFVYASGFPRELDIGFVLLPLGVLQVPLALVGFISMTNVYNFMDGSHGLAALQALFVTAVLSGVFLYHGDTELAWVALILFAYMLGFLPWNFPHGRIFMGDVGSGALGFVLAGLVVLGAHRGALPMLVGAMLLGVFLLDAATTLIHRWSAGRRWYTPHREHLYQVLIRGGWSHRRVALAFSLVNVLVALPMALIAMRWPPMMLPLMAGFAVSFTIVWRYVRVNFRDQKRASSCREQEYGMGNRANQRLGSPMCRA